MGAEKREKRRHLAIVCATTLTVFLSATIFTSRNPKRAVVGNSAFRSRIKPASSLYPNWRRNAWVLRPVQQRHLCLRAKNQTSSLDSLGALLGEGQDGVKSTSQSLGALLGDRNEAEKNSPKPGSVEALYEVAKQETGAKVTRRYLHVCCLHPCNISGREQGRSNSPSFTCS
mmetsp:Transcript_18657/g.35221  ORF Transcript_18657/g.35221 Transcript_18657/m.35221 type:complete len:172 (+) Transcript_18657:32-547(+)